MSRRSVRRKNYDHRAFKLAVLVILMGLITYMAYFWVFRISPNLEAVSAIKGFDGSERLSSLAGWLLERKK